MDNMPPLLTPQPPTLTPQLHKDNNYQLLSEPVSASAGEGVDWLKAGWAVISGKVWTFIGALVVMVIIAIVLQLIPKIGGIIYWLLSSVFTAGFAYMFHQKAEGNPVSVGQLFAGFRQYMGQLVLISIWTFLGLILIAMILFGLVMMMGGAGSFQTGTIRNPFAFFSLRLFILMIVGLLLYIPLMMAQWISPTLVILHGLKAIDAMKLSFQACLKNMLPLLVLGIVAMLMVFGAMLVMGFSMGLLFQAKIFIVLLILAMVVVEVVFALVLMASNYVAYRSVLTNQPLT